MNLHPLTERSSPGPTADHPARLVPVGVQQSGELPLSEISALFVRTDSHYKALGLDCYDVSRDARTWRGGSPGIYHPPCRAWGQLKAFAKPRPDEKDLARWSMFMVRQFSGVVEHPLNSELWKEFHCCSFGVRDQFGGVLIPVYQCWFGHRAPKPTGLYIVGRRVPSLPFDFTLPPGRVERMGKAEREKTPEPFARFLVDLVRS